MIDHFIFSLVEFQNPQDIEFIKENSNPGFKYNKVSIIKCSFNKNVVYEHNVLIKSDFCITE